MRSRVHRSISSRASPPLSHRRLLSQTRDPSSYNLTSNPQSIIHRTIRTKPQSELPPWLSLLVSCPNPTRFALFRPGSPQYTLLFTLSDSSCFISFFVAVLIFVLPFSIRNWNLLLPNTLMDPENGESFVNISLPVIRFLILGFL